MCLFRSHSQVYLPPKLYRQPGDGKAQVSLGADKSFLPVGFQLAKKNKFDALIAEEPEDESVH